MKSILIAALAVVLTLITVFVVRMAVGAGSPTHQRTMIAVPQAAPKQLWHCGMHPQVIEDHPGNCPICHMPLTPMNPSGGGDPMSARQRKILYWWDPMLGPSSISDHPGKSAMGMDRVPVYADQVSGGSQITIDPRVVQEMGVQTAAVSRGPLHQTLRAVGIFKMPEPGMHDIALKVGGWIDTLYANQDGMHVHRGEPLFALYSPELQVAEQELISAVQSRRALSADASADLKDQSDALVASARRKLELWDVDARQIDAIAASRNPPRDVIFYSPATGHLEDKAVVQGSAVQPGIRLMRIADHTTMWLEAQIYQSQVPLIQLGQTVKVTLDAIPGKTFSGKISFIYPNLDSMTRTLSVRATLDNPNFQFKPGMYADADVITEPLADVIQTPQEAVIDTGVRHIVFVDQGAGHFAPRTVRTGLRGDNDRIQIVQGLAVGERVVVSGEFLMDVESRTQEAIAKLRGGAADAGAADAGAADAGAPSTQPVSAGG